MAVDMTGLDVSGYQVLGVRVNDSNLPAPRWVLARNAQGHLVLVQWDFSAQMLAYESDGSITTVGG